MRRILYASGGFVTDNAIAHALMDYASVLAVVGSSDVVECKGLDETGTVRSIQLLLGPASQIMAMQTDDADIEMDVDATVAELQRRARWRLPDYTSVGEGAQQSDAARDADAHDQAAE